MCVGGLVRVRVGARVNTMLGGQLPIYTRSYAWSNAPWLAPTGPMAHYRPYNHPYIPVPTHPHTHNPHIARPTPGAHRPFRTYRARPIKPVRRPAHPSSEPCPQPRHSPPTPATHSTNPTHRTPTHLRARTHTRTRTRTHAHTHTHTHTHTHATHPHETPPRSTHPRTPATRPYMYASRTHTYTRTHTVSGRAHG